MNPLFITIGKPALPDTQNGTPCICLTVLCLMLLTPWQGAVAGGIYKSVDSEGNVFFTDQPLENAETISGRPADKSGELSNSEQPTSNEESDADDDHKEIPPAATVLVAPEPINPPKTENTELDEPAKILPVTQIEILTPPHDTLLIDPLGQIWVEAQSYPTPISESGLTAQLWLNDDQITSQQSPIHRLPPPPRGTHILRVKLVDSQGRLVIESTAVNIHVKYQYAEQ